MTFLHALPVAFVVVAVAGPFLALGFCAVRDRHGTHPKDNRPVGGTSDERYARQARYGLYLEHDFSRAMGDLERAERERLIAKRETFR